MLKKILCIALIVAIVGAAVGFIVYDKVGKTYNYEDKDMTKYLSTAFTPEQIKNMALDLSKVDAWEEIKIDNKKVGYAVAAAIAGIDDKEKEALEGGKLSLYDELTFLYYVTLEDGTVVSNPALMDYTVTEAKRPAFQIGQDPVVEDEKADATYPQLSGLISSALIGKDYQIFTNSIIASGNVEANDTIWVEYTVNKLNAEDASKVDSSVTYKYQMTTIAELDALTGGDVDLAGLNASFTAKQAEIVTATAKNQVPQIIGTDLKGLTVTAANVSVDMKILFVSRAIVTEGDMVDGDTLYFTYKEKGNAEAKAVQLVITKDDNGKAAMLEAFGSDDFYNKLTELKIGDDNKDIEIVLNAGAENESKKTYTVSIDYATPADPAAEREGLTKANACVGPIELTYPEDSKAVQYDATGAAMKDADGKEITLAGKKVNIYLYVMSGTHVAYDKFETFYEDLKFTSTNDDDNKAIYDYLKAVNDLKAAEKALADEEAKGDKKDDEKIEDLTKKRDDAKTALDTATKAYNKLKGVAEDTVRNADEDIKAEYEEYQRKQVQKEVNSDRAYAVAEVYWNTLLAEVKKGSIEYPSHAVKLAKKGILDAYKTEYYGKRDTDYKEYKTFNSYLAKQYEGKDKNAAILAEAQEAVLGNMLIHYLADIYGITLDEDERITDNVKELYAMLMNGGKDFPAGYWEAAETGTLFDKVMEKIVEDREPNLDNDKIK